MEYQNKDIKTATQETIDIIGKMGGDGGLIALDKDGNMAMPFNTAGMYRGAITENGEIEVFIYQWYDIRGTGFEMQNMKPETWNLELETKYFEWNLNSIK